MPDRRRDSDGRPRNDRPRDQLGRPLQHGAPDERIPPPELPATSREVLELAQALLDAGRPFEAHEVLEEQWKRAAQEQRPLWRALAQLAVAVTHQLRGNASGARALAQRSVDVLDEVAPGPDLDLAGLVAYANRLVAGGPGDPPPRLLG